MEKKYFTHFKDGKIIYRMVDERSKTEHICNLEKTKFFLYRKYKPCNLVLYSKEIIALNPDVDKSYGYKYTYQIVPDPTKRFIKLSIDEVFADNDILIGEFITTIKDN
jgi:hypothetical protein